MNCVRIRGGTLAESIPDIGCTCDTLFISSGNNLFLTSESFRHDTRTCSVESVITAVHSEHARLDVELSVSVIRSQVRNLRYNRSFLQSCVVSIFCSAGCGRPDRPFRFTLRNLIFELF